MSQVVEPEWARTGAYFSMQSGRRIGPGQSRQVLVDQPLGALDGVIAELARFLRDPALDHEGVFWLKRWALNRSDEDLA